MKHSNKAQAKQGISSVAALAVLVSLAIVGFAVYQLVKDDGQATQTITQSGGADAASESDAAQSAVTGTSSMNAVEIPEWGVRVAFDDADKVEYTITNDDPSVPYAKSYAKLVLKQNVTADEACRDLGANITRDPVAGPGDISIKVGEYNYRVGGSPSTCAGDPGGANGTINQLRQNIVGQQLSQGKFNVTALQ